MRLLIAVLLLAPVSTIAFAQETPPPAQADAAKQWLRDFGKTIELVEGNAGQAGLDAAEQLVAFARGHFGKDGDKTLVSEQWRGQAYMRMGRYAEADAIWTALLPRFEKNFGKAGAETVALFANLASLKRDRGKLDEAAAMGEQALAAQVLKYGEDNIDTFSARNNLANIYADAGNFQKAKQLHEQTLAARERLLGPDHPHTLTSVHNLATVLDELYEMERAETLMRRAFESRERVLGADDPATLGSARYLGSIIRQRGDERGARVLYERAYNGLLTKLGPEHPDTLSSLAQLANVMEADARYAEAEPILIKLLAVRERLLGPDHPDTLSSVKALAGHYKAIARYDLAAPLFERLVAGRVRVLGPTHPNTLGAKSDLAWLKFDRGEIAVATAMLEDVYRENMRQTGRESARTIDALFALGILDSLLDRHDQAEKKMREALAANARVLGAQHPSTMDVQLELSRLLRERSRYEEAKALLAPVRATYAERFGANSPQVLEADVEAAVLAFYEGRYGEAEARYRDVLARNEKLFGPDHPNTLTAVNNLGVNLSEQGRFADAQPLLQRAYDGYAKLYGADDQETIGQKITLGDIYRDQARYALAEKTLRDSYEAAVAKLGDDSAVALRAANQLGHTLRLSGRPAEAERWYRLALAGRIKVLGAEHRSTLFTTLKLATVLRDQGKFAEAEPLFGRVLATQLRTLRPGHIDFADSYSDFGGLLAAKGSDPAKVAFFYKQAINVLQGTRAEMRDAGSLDSGSTQQSFIAVWTPVYIRLQALLVGQGRFAEAEQVGRMLKETEYVSLVRAAKRNAGDGLTLTTRESEWAAQLTSWADKPNRLAGEIDKLNARKAAGTALSALEQRQLGELQGSYDAAYATYQTTINGWLGEVRKLGDEQLQEEARELEVKFSDKRRAEIAAIGPDVALLQIVAFDKSVEFFLITPKAMKHVSAPVGREQLFQAIYEARDLLRSGVADRKTRDPAHQALVRQKMAALYDMLLRPVAGELTDAGTKTLMLNLQGKIRYAPFSALFDGKQWLIENYRLALYTPAANTSFTTPARMDGGSGLGLSRALPGFDALPAVPRELEAILTGSDRTGALKGDIALDGAFTRTALETALSKREPVLHIASHFKMEPGIEASSFLLLGDGSKLTLAEIGQSSKLSFNGVELVTFSACETGLGGDGTGMEIDGLGALAQNKGAGSVVATLWSVVDDSTATLMTEFYTRLADGRSDKAEALRQAQLKLIANPATADPYFWSPFILMGNWK